jgi:raffinose/stachyose/melibiose transport system permease protein
MQQDASSGVTGARIQLRRKATGVNRTLNRWRTWVWVLPAVILLVVFVYYPIVENIRLSFFSWSAFSARPTFVGLDNYRTAAADPVFWRSLLNNTLFAITSLVFQVGFSLVLAAVLEEFVHQRLRGLLRTIYFIPAAISITVSGILFSFIYNPQIGLLNSALSAVGLDSWTHAWLGEQGTAMWSIIAMSQWQSFGYTAVLFVVAIQRVPREFYEAAKVDGAGPFARLRYVTIPMLRPTTLFLLVVGIIGSFQIFTQIYIMTNGGPAERTTTMVFFIYQAAFKFYDMGYASTLAFGLFALLFVVTLLQLRLYRKGE